MLSSDLSTPSLPWRFGRMRPVACQCSSQFCQDLHHRVMADMSRRLFLGGLLATLAPFALGQESTPAAVGNAQAGAGKQPVLLTNLRLFDGSQLRPANSVNVLIEGQLVKALPETSAVVPDAITIDCQGKLVMPGMIDAHWHSMLVGLDQMSAMTADLGYLYLVAAQQAQKTLMRGFTTVRDAGGPAFALKRAIDEKITTGPRIYPSGAMISQTAGHGDFRFRSEVPRSASSELSMIERAGVAMIADGDTEVLRRVREQLLLGASQIKMLAGGGVASMYDPLDTSQFTERELRSAVDAASDWNTYVMAHVYTPKGIQRAIRSGAQSIEHGQLADEDSVKMMRDEGVWWSLQPFLQDSDSNVYPDEGRRSNQLTVSKGTANAYELAQKYAIKTGWGTDILFNPKLVHTQGRQLAKLTRFYDPLTLLSQATKSNGELVALSGARNPYPHTLGQIQPGAYADLLVFDGDPKQNLDFIADPDKNLHLIMKDGVVYKNTL